MSTPQNPAHNLLASGAAFNKLPLLPSTLRSKADGEANLKSSFGEDFLQEHCLAGDAKKTASARDLSDCPQAFGFPC